MTTASAKSPPSANRLFRLREIARRRREREEETKTAPIIALLSLGYFAVGLMVNVIDAEYLTAAWLFAGALAFALWMARESKKSPLNVFTVLFSVGVAVCLGCFVLSRGWLT